jgi:hypothetical protein
MAPTEITHAMVRDHLLGTAPLPDGLRVELSNGGGDRRASVLGIDVLDASGAVVASLLAEISTEDE